MPRKKNDTQVSRQLSRLSIFKNLTGIRPVRRRRKHSCLINFIFLALLCGASYYGINQITKSGYMQSLCKVGSTPVKAAKIIKKQAPKRQVYNKTKNSKKYTYNQSKYNNKNLVAKNKKIKKVKRQQY